MVELRGSLVWAGCGILSHFDVPSSTSHTKVLLGCDLFPVVFGGSISFVLVGRRSGTALADGALNVYDCAHSCLHLREALQCDPFVSGRNHGICSSPRYDGGPPKNSEPWAEEGISLTLAWRESIWKSRFCVVCCLFLADQDKSRITNKSSMVVFNILLLGYALLVHSLSNSFLQQTVELRVRGADSKIQGNATSSLLELTCDARRIYRGFCVVFLLDIGHVPICVWFRALRPLHATDKEQKRPIALLLRQTQSS